MTGTTAPPLIQPAVSAWNAEVNSGIERAIGILIIWLAIPPDAKNGADIHNKMGYWIDIVRKRYPNKDIDEDIQRPTNMPKL